MVIIGVNLLTRGIILSISFIWYGAFLIPIGAILIKVGSEINNNRRLNNSLHNTKFVGRSLSSIEQII